MKLERCCSGPGAWPRSSRQTCRTSPRGLFLSLFKAFSLLFSKLGRIKVFSQNVVDCNYDRLSLLDVRDCSASSQADKEVILQKILDVEAFNLRLQHLVFSSQGLFSQWVDGKERSRQVGRIWRRSSCQSQAWDEKERLRPEMSLKGFQRL